MALASTSTVISSSKALNSAGWPEVCFGGLFFAVDSPLLVAEYVNVEAGDVGDIPAVKLAAGALRTRTPRLRKFNCVAMVVAKFRVNI
jgi:hypothetical protein